MRRRRVRRLDAVPLCNVHEAGSGILPRRPLPGPSSVDRGHKTAESKRQRGERLQMSHERLEAKLAAHGGFSSLLAFRPTGWSFSKAPAKSKGAVTTGPSNSVAGGASGAAGAPLCNSGQDGVTGVAGTTHDAPRNAFGVLMRQHAPARGAAAPPPPGDAFTALMGAARRHAAAAAEPPWLQGTRRGRVEVCSVPYSEHSSFAELRAFAAWLQPVAVVPTVNRGASGDNVPRMLRLLAGA